MALVREKEQSAETIAHVLDDMLRIPGTRMRIGADPLLGLIPLIGDAIATLLGTSILLTARQLNVPWTVVAHMSFNLFKNGLIGSVPFIGDAYSFHFKCNAVNAALLLRAVREGEDGACSVTTHSVSLLDVLGLIALTVPSVALAGLLSLWFWDHNISYLSVFFPAPYSRR
jgi:hypothetical protein